MAKLNERILIRMSKAPKTLFWQQPLITMNFFRQYISPLIILLIFLFALLAVSARIFLPSDLAAPAPIEEDNLVSCTNYFSFG